MTTAQALHLATELEVAPDLLVVEDSEAIDHGQRRPRHLHHPLRLEGEVRINPSGGTLCTHTMMSCGLNRIGDTAQRIMNAMRENGVLVGLDGPFGNVLKIRPPMPFGIAEADLLVEVLQEGLERES